MFPRRGFLQKTASVALLFLASRSQLIVAALKGRALPKFSLGDKVATDWSDDWGGHYLDFGEVVSLCYLPSENTWYADKASAPPSPRWEKTVIPA
jgi:hypothetical protein